jgi:hypothetical protein
MLRKESIFLVMTSASVLTLLFLGMSMNALVLAREQKFTAKLTAREEVPPNDSPATGLVWVNASEKQAGFKINVRDLDKANAAHIHFGKKGENGPIIVTLFKSDKPTELKNGTLGQGNFSASNFEGPMKGKQLTDLVTAMKNGSAYVNVHTTDLPKGEIRGQLASNSTG